MADVNSTAVWCRWRRGTWWGDGFGGVGVVGNMARRWGHGFGKVGVVGNMARRWRPGFGEVGVVGDMACGWGRGFGEVGVVGDVARGSDGVHRFNSCVGIVVKVACGRCVDLAIWVLLVTWHAMGRC